MGVIAKAQYQGASQAPNGTGKYKSQIYWVNWDVDNDGYPNDVINGNQNTTISRSVEVPGGITYTITLTQKASSTQLVSYVSGWWDWDDLKEGYNWFKNSTTPYNFRYYYNGTGNTVPSNIKYDYSGNTGWSRAYNSQVDAHNSIIGLKNQNQNSSANFNIKISGVYTGTATPVPSHLLKGFVFAGAESLQGNGSTNFNASAHEYYTLNNLSNTNPWRVIDTVQNKVPSGYTHYGVYSWAGYEFGFTEAANVESNGAKITLYNGNTSTLPARPATPANPGGNTEMYFEGPGDVVWMADAATNVDVSFKGNGYTALAVGFIYSTDLGDAPSSYGTQVTNIQEVNYQGGNLSNGTSILINNVALATLTDQHLLIGAKVDGESIQPYTSSCNGDDVMGSVNDEDGLTATGAIAQWTKNSFNQSITVPVINTTNTNATLFGWIDINKNGFFETSEMASTVVLSPGTPTVVLNWTLSDSMRVGQSYILRLRILDGSNTNIADNVSTPVDERAINSYVFGETEDHSILTVTPLPIQMGQLIAYESQCSNMLTWETFKEEDGLHFELEKSTNGKDFKTLAEIDIQGMAHKYTYTDKQDLSIHSFYRLKVVNTNGSSYSNIAPVINNCMNSLQVYPTLASSILYIKGAKYKQYWTITNTLGQMQRRGDILMDESSIDISQLQNGVYYISFQNELGDFVIHKFVKY